MTLGWSIIMFVLVVAAYVAGYLRADAIHYKLREKDQLDTFRTFEQELRRGDWR